MKQTNIRLAELFQKYMENDITETETSEFSGYLDDPGYSMEIHDLLAEAFKKQSNDIGLTDKGCVRVLQNILGVEFQNKPASRFKLWPRIVAVAAAVAIIVSGVYFFNYMDHKPDPGLTYAHDIAPGKVGATLTLANGEKISLTDAHSGELAKEAGISITKTADGQVVYSVSSLREGTTKQSYNTLTTAKGETYILTLPDKSKVWMNAASSLTYNAALNVHGVRKVKLDGEAYFEISKDKMHPFIVESKGQQVEVLGTHFNINAYKEEPSTKTTLFEGSVNVTPLTAMGKEDKNRGGKGKTLKPGQQASLMNNGIEVTEADTESVLAWKNGDFLFNGEDFRAAMRKIARWYDVDIVYDSLTPRQVKLGGWVSRSKNISAVLKVIESTGEIHFKIDGRRIVVTQ